MSIPTVILAAGEGKRFRESGGQGPKQLAKIAGITSLLTEVMLQSPSSDNEVLVVLGYEHKLIEEEISKELTILDSYSSRSPEPHKWWKFIYNDKWNQLGTAHSLLCAKESILALGRNQPFFVISGDQIVDAQAFEVLRGVYNRDPHEMYAAGSTQCHSNSPQNIFVRYPSLQNDSLSIKGQYKIYYTKRADFSVQSNCNFLYDMGAYLFNPTIFDAIEDCLSAGKDDLMDVFNKLATINAVTAYPFDSWYNINTVEDLKKYERETYAPTSEGIQESLG